jgi:hypothetical protein
MAALFFALCAVTLFWMAFHEERGVSIEGLIDLGPGAARILFAILGAASVCFVAIASYALITYHGETPEVIVDDDSITTPGPVWRLAATRTVRFAEVTAIREQKINGQHFVTLVAPNGKVWIARSHLADGAFDEILDFLRTRIAGTNR